ncbi:CLAVATA3/ESR-related 40 [Senna tora]|uniref:CLAVATA3/ESR-related 40 n=1 Tax=Senna tora TaxID=362788 RepID=A0A834WKR7_9FABA|nr:CLAVATA3/ESR-related 40 [Senna tora]
MEVPATSDQSNKENTPPIPMNEKEEEKKKKHKKSLIASPVASSFKKTCRRRKLKRIPLADITNLFVDHSHQQNDVSATENTMTNPSSQSVLLQWNSRRRRTMAPSSMGLNNRSLLVLKLGSRHSSSSKHGPHHVLKRELEEAGTIDIYKEGVDIRLDSGGSRVGTNMRGSKKLMVLLLCLLILVNIRHLEGRPLLHYEGFLFLEKNNKSSPKQALPSPQSQSLHQKSEQLRESFGKIIEGRNGINIIPNSDSYANRLSPEGPDPRHH